MPAKPRPFGSRSSISTKRQPLRTAEATAEGAGLSPRRLHPASPFIGVLLLGRQLAPALVLLFLGRSSFDSFDFGLAAVPAGLVALVQFVSWRRFRYQVRDGALVVDKGILNRSHREIPVERIHHVEERAKIYHRVLGVVSLKIDSGGGESGAEIELDALSRREAALLRAAIDSRPTLPQPVVDRTESPLVAIGVARLVLAGVTNVPFLATAAAFGSIVELGEDSVARLARFAVDRAPGSVAGIGLAVALGAGMFVALAGGASVLANYGYVLYRRDHELRTQRGLLDTRRAVADLRRLTAIRIEELLIRRILGLCSIRLQTISGGSSGVSQITVPILDRRDVDGLLAELMPAGAPLPQLEAHPQAARRRLVVRRVALHVLVAAPLAVFWPPWGLLVAALLLVLAVLHAEVAYRALGHATRGDVLVSREGGLRQKTAVTTWTRAESTRLRSSPLQRWAGLATLKVDVPQGRSVSVVDADPSDLQQLRQLALRRPLVP